MPPRVPVWIAPVPAGSRGRHEPARGPETA